jgi:hypothetical protein
VALLIGVLISLVVSVAQEDLNSVVFKPLRLALGSSVVGSDGAPTVDVDPSLVQDPVPESAPAALDDAVSQILAGVDAIIADTPREFTVRSPMRSSKAVMITVSSSPPRSPFAQRPLASDGESTAQVVWRAPSSPQK